MRESGLLIREKILLDLMMLHILWILATPDCFRSVALRFGTYPSTVHRHYVRIIEAICDLAPRYIQWPSPAEREVTKAAFERYAGFPGVVGLIDGTFVNITAPTIQPRRYINRHHQYAFNIQVVCDHTKDNRHPHRRKLCPQ